MRIQNENTDAAILEELGQRLTRVRLGRNLKQEDMAMAAGLSKRTVERMEAGHSVQMSSFIRALRALHVAENLDILVPDTGPGPLAQLKLKGKDRYRASTTRKAAASTGPWTWGDK